MATTTKSMKNSAKTRRTNAGSRKVIVRDSCGSRLCDAGGPPQHNGHVFALPYEVPEQGLSGGQCRCGMDNITFTLLTVG